MNRTNGSSGTGVHGVAYYRTWGAEWNNRPLAVSDEWKKVEREFTVNLTPKNAAMTIALYAVKPRSDYKIWSDDVRVEMRSAKDVESEQGKR